MKRALALLILASLPLAGQPPRAEAVNEDPALERDPGNDFFTRAENLYIAAREATEPATQKARYERATQVLTEYLKDFPKHANAERAWWYLADSYQQTGRDDEARRSYRSLVEGFDKSLLSAAAAHRLAEEHYEKGEYAQAAPLFERFAAGAPKPKDQAAGHFFAADSYLRSERWQEAAANFRKVIENPAGVANAPQAKLALGRLLFKEGKQQEALELFAEVADGDHPPALKGNAAREAALAATKLNRPQVAEKYLRQILATQGMEPLHAEAQTALMATSFAKEDYREVVRLYRSSEAQAKGETEARRLRFAAHAFYRLSDFKGARELFRQVESQLPPKDELAIDAGYHRLLCSFEIDGRYQLEELDAFLKTYRPSRPKDSRIQTVLMIKAETLFADDKAAAAAEIFREIDAGAVGEKNRPTLLFKRGWALAEAGDSPAAIQALSEFIDQFPKDDRRPQALAKRARLHADAGEPAKAVADYDQLIQSSAPKEITTLAYLESARLRQASDELPDMIARYKKLLSSSDELKSEIRGEANYSIGWGLVKSDAANEAIPFLETARELRPKAYAKQAGLLLAVAHFSAQDYKRLAAEIDRAIDGKFANELPEPALQWAGMQAYQTDDFASAARYLRLTADFENPDHTSKAVWRFLSKSLLKTKDSETALKAVDHLLTLEEHAGWQADGLHDKGRALLGLNRVPAAREVADEGLALRPPPRTKAELTLLSGDLHLTEGDAALAARDFLDVATFNADPDLKPLALWKLEQALGKMDDKPQAAKYRAQREAEFPDWKAPLP